MPWGVNRKWLTSGVLAQVIGGWTVTSLWTFQSGFPYNVFDGADPCLRAGGYTPSCRPNLVGDPDEGPRTADQWLNVLAYRRTGPGEFGSAPRNSFRGPDLVNTDIALIKRVSMGGVRRGMNLELRIEAFNAFNRVNLGVPNLNIASATFGRIGSTATDAREFQFGVKLSF